MELLVVIVVCVAWWAVSRHADLWRPDDPGARRRVDGSTPVLPPASSRLARDPDLGRAGDGAFVDGYIVGRYVGERRTVAELADAGLVPAVDGADLDDVDLWTVDAADLQGSVVDPVVDVEVGAFDGYGDGPPDDPFAGSLDDPFDGSLDDPFDDGFDDGFDDDG